MADEPWGRFDGSHCGTNRRAAANPPSIWTTIRFAPRGRIPTGGGSGESDPTAAISSKLITLSACPRFDPPRNRRNSQTDNRVVFYFRLTHFNGCKQRLDDGRMQQALLQVSNYPRRNMNEARLRILFVDQRTPSGRRPVIQASQDDALRYVS